MAKTNTVTCSFTMNRDLYNQYKSIIVRSGKNVKGDLVRYMQDVIAYETPNAETIEAIKEVEQMKSNPSIGKAYNDVDEMMRTY
nr:hypothetical protein [Butyrivibrio fibrisolvens]